ncbi:MAG: hypothetical protein V1722_05795 [Candidatus Micrarchaeota archaeon]
MYGELSDAALGFLLGPTGLLPFLHANTIVELTKNVDFANFGLFAAALVFTRLPFELAANSFGLASENTVLSIGNYNVKPILYSCLAAMVVSILFFPFYSLTAGFIAPILKPIAGFLLVVVFTCFIVTQENKFSTLTISLLAGAVGVITLEKNISNSLFILLTGLFAVPMLFEKQEKTALELTNKNISWKHTVIGSVIGMSSAFLPAMTPAFLTSIAFGVIGKKEDFLTLNAAVVGSRLVSDFAAVEFIRKGRSGATAKMLENNFFTFTEIATLLLIGLVCAAVAAFVIIKFEHKMPKIHENKLFLGGALALVTAYIFATSGVVGIACLAVCSLVGLTCISNSVNKGALGAAVLFPALLHAF